MFEEEKKFTVTTWAKHNIKTSEIIDHIRKRRKKTETHAALAAIKYFSFEYRIHASNEWNIKEVCKTIH